MKRIGPKVTILSSLFVIGICHAQSGLVPTAATSRFIGTWKEDESKRKLSSAPGLEFRTTADGGLEDVRGGPTAGAQAIHADGKPYPLGAGNTVVWKQNGRNQFERQFFVGEQLSTTRRLQISGGGKMLTEEMERKTPNGKSIMTTAIFERSSGTGAGLAGTWKLVSLRSEHPEEITLTAAGPNSLTYLNGQGLTYTATLDDKPVPVSGPSVQAGTMIALIRPLDDYTIISTLSRNGVVTGRGTIVVSTDGKIMTTAVQNTGRGANPEPSVRVWEKQ